MHMSHDVLLGPWACLTSGRCDPSSLRRANGVHPSTVTLVLVHPRATWHEWHLLAGLAGRSGKRGREGRLPSVSELPMPTFLDLSEARLSGKHGVLHISLPRDLSLRRVRVHRCARLICRHIMIITNLLLARGVAETNKDSEKRFRFWEACRNHKSPIASTS